MLHTKGNDSTLFIIVEKDIHFEHSADLEGAVKDFKIPEDTTEISIDLAKVRFIDSTGVGFLITWLHPLSQKYKIEFTGTNEHVKKILNICKLDQFATVL